MCVRRAWRCQNQLPHSSRSHLTGRITPRRALLSPQGGLPAQLIDLRRGPGLVPYSSGPLMLPIEFHVSAEPGTSPDSERRSS
jgi:hypothetical protein